ncbi:hypothetical protein Goklo_023738, partial [Gossypium klotzschianum]|nr:hypothetical protein [Gossypium klotzschianum]
AIQIENVANNSYKTKLLSALSGQNSTVNKEKDFELQDGDVATEVVDGVSSITFFDRIHQFIERKVAWKIVIKLLGKKIGFNALLNKVSSLWKLGNQFQLMDLENDFYLIRFHDKDDFDKVLVGGPWVIDQVISPVVKINKHTNTTVRGCFARLAVCVDLKKLLISKVRINGRRQRVEYESLPNVYFTCGLYEYSSTLCLWSKLTMVENSTGCSEPAVEKSDCILGLRRNQTARVEIGFKNHSDHNRKQEAKFELEVDLMRFVGGKGLNAVGEAGSGKK